jgi:hypothetical protein
MSQQPVALRNSFHGMIGRPCHTRGTQEHYARSGAFLMPCFCDLRAQLNCAQTVARRAPASGPALSAKLAASNAAHI